VSSEPIFYTRNARIGVHKPRATVHHLRSKACASKCRCIDAKRQPYNVFYKRARSGFGRARARPRPRERLLGGQGKAENQVYCPVNMDWVDFEEWFREDPDHNVVIDIYPFFCDVKQPHQTEEAFKSSVASFVRTSFVAVALKQVFDNASNTVLSKCVSGRGTWLNVKATAGTTAENDNTVFEVGGSCGIEASVAVNSDLQERLKRSHGGFFRLSHLQPALTIRRSSLLDASLKLDRQTRQFTAKYRGKTQLRDIYSPKLAAALAAYSAFVPCQIMNDYHMYHGQYAKAHYKAAVDSQKPASVQAWRAAKTATKEAYHDNIGKWYGTGIEYFRGAVQRRQKGIRWIQEKLRHLDAENKEADDYFDLSKEDELKFQLQKNKLDTKLKKHIEQLQESQARLEAIEACGRHFKTFQDIDVALLQGFAEEADVEFAPVTVYRGESSKDEATFMGSFDEDGVRYPRGYVSTTTDIYAAQRYVYATRGRRGDHYQSDPC